MRHLIAAMLIFGCAARTAPAKADWEYTRWGMTPDQVAAASNGAVTVIPQAGRKRVAEVKMESGAEGTMTEGALQLHVVFSFDTGGAGLVAVGYNVLNEAQNEMLKNWLLRKYGPPHSKSGIEAIGLATWDWETPDDIEMNISSGSGGFVLQSKRK